MSDEKSFVPQMHFLPIGPTSDHKSSMIASPTVPEYLSFYSIYGECFAAWSDVESRLLAIFIFLLQSPDYHATAAAFYSTVGFRAKLNLVNEVVINSKSISDSDLTQWKPIYDEASKKSRRRNELAHNTIFYGRQHESNSRRMFLGSPHKPFEFPRLHANDLVEVRDSFYSLGQKIFAFWQRLLSAREQQA